MSTQAPQHHQILPRGHEWHCGLDIQSGVKQGCVLVPTLFGIFFAKHAFGSTTEGIYLRTRSDRKLFNLSRLRAKSKVQLKCLPDFLFANDATILVVCKTCKEEILIFSFYTTNSCVAKYCELSYTEKYLILFLALF